MKLGHRLVCTFTFVMSTIGATQSARAWGDIGHSAVGQIAEYILASRSPETLRSIHATVGVEPLYISATWPDQVRDDERFKDFGPYHFSDIPVDPKKPAKKDAMTVLLQYPGILSDPRVPREAKMIAFRYLVHVVGDIHQPLHLGYEADHGGNACSVNWQPRGSQRPYVVKLHAVWDTKIVEYIVQNLKAQSPNASAFFGFKQLAQALMAKYPNIVNANHRLDLLNWVNESRQLVFTQAYPDQLSPEQRIYCKKPEKELAANEIPVLDQAFANRIVPTVEVQLVLAGARLATALQKLFAQANGPQISDQAVLEMLKLTNESAQAHRHGQ